MLPAGDLAGTLPPAVALLAGTYLPLGFFAVMGTGSRAALVAWSRPSGTPVACSAAGARRSLW